MDEKKLTQDLNKLSVAILCSLKDIKEKLIEDNIAVFKVNELLVTISVSKESSD